jgi:iron-sulfur cluster assembly protein
MIELSQTAVEEFRRLMVEQNRPDAVVRIGVESGGCSGLQYSMDFDDTVRDDDTVFEQGGGLKVVVASGELTYLDGLQVDFTKKLMGGGFRMENPNASRSCGCGTSFRI